MVPLSPRRLAEAFDVFATPRALLATVDEVTSDDESNPKFKLHESAVNGLSSSASSSCSSGASPRELQKPSGLSEETWSRMLELREKVADVKRRLRNFLIAAREKQENGELDENHPVAGDSTVVEVVHAASEESGGEEDEEKDFDMFALSSSPQKRKRTKSSGGGPPRKRAAVVPAELQAVDSYDDAEGYYKATIGELMDSKYVISSGLCGKGVFSTVVRAVTEDMNGEVAIKIIRRNDLMRSAGEKEAEILRRLNEGDKENKRHIVRLVSTFDHRKHLCLVFEAFSYNLRTLLKDFGRTGRGFNFAVLMTYTRQLMIALRHMKKHGYMHADIKPDNILVNKELNCAKLCDFGSAADITDNEVTSYLVSRYYRAPEIILGYRYGYPIDMWSMGCTLYEVAVGKFLFTGRNNNNMVYQMMEIQGRFPKHMLKNSAFALKHFADDLKDFILVEWDPKSKKLVNKRISIPQQPVKTIYGLLVENIPLCQGSEPKSVILRDKTRQFARFLTRCLALDPSRRITPEEALNDPFLVEPMKFGNGT